MSELFQIVVKVLEAAVGITVVICVSWIIRKHQELHEIKLKVKLEEISLQRVKKSIELMEREKK